MSSQRNTLFPIWWKPLLTITETVRIEHLLLLFRLKITTSRTTRQKTGKKQARQPIKNTPLLCNHCTYPITTFDQARKVKGRHTHTFFNPHGTVFTLRCFLNAPGCFLQGAPSSEFSWFAGYTWQMAFCKSCHQQLGWCFLGEDRNNTFWALISNKLI